MASVQGPSSPLLKLFVDKERNKVVVGEASGDFIDALFSFLTLPLGTIIRLQSAEIGCINNLYRSVQNFNTQVFWNGICKKMLLHPRNPCEKLCRKLRFNVDDTEPTKYLICGSCKSSSGKWLPTKYLICGSRRHSKGVSGKWLSTFAEASCSSCGKLMDQEIKVKEEEDNNTEGDGVFVSGQVMYLVSDDLMVLQSSPGNFAKQLAQLGYTDLTKLTEFFPNDCSNKIGDLLKCALISTSSLTDVFLGQEAGGTMSSFRPVLASSYFGWNHLHLRITVSKSKNKILYAEAEEDFADFLFSFLSMPLGSTLKLLHGNVNLGSMHNLYKSVKDLKPSCFGRYRSPCHPYSPLLDLKVAPQNGCKKQPLDVREEESPSYNYFCGLIMKDYITKDCTKKRNASSMELFEPRCADGRGEAVGFVRRPAVFAVMDDLQVIPLTSTSSVSFLQELRVPLNDLEEHKVTIHRNEALNLLGESLTSKAALTNGLFYLLKKPKEEATT